MASIQFSENSTTLRTRTRSLDETKHERDSPGESLRQAGRQLTVSELPTPDAHTYMAYIYVYYFLTPSYILDAARPPAFLSEKLDDRYL